MNWAKWQDIRFVPRHGEVDAAELRAGLCPVCPDFVAGDLGVIAESHSYDDLIVKLDE